VQDYLKAIHGLGGADQVVSPVEIAARLEVRSPSVTGMLNEWRRRALIGYEPGHGARLTEQGISEARRVIRRHRLLELFLARVWAWIGAKSMLKPTPWNTPISPRLEQALAAYLGEPLEDPHGHPIPRAKGP